MPTSAATARRCLAAPLQRARRRGQQGFALVEMLVAMMLLSLVGLTLARFQSFQIAGTANVAAAAAARLEADNVAIDLIAAPDAPSAALAGRSANLGREWHWTATPYPSPDPALMPDLVLVDVAVAASAEGPPLAWRRILRPRSYARDAAGEGAAARPAAPQ